VCRHGVGILHEIMRIVRNVLRGCVVLRHCITVRGGNGSWYRVGWPGWEHGTVDRCVSPHFFVYEDDNWSDGSSEGSVDGVVEEELHMS
jgi:hypothetical protein